MTEETVQRLDYSKPPPEYTADGQWWSHPPDEPSKLVFLGGHVDTRNVARVAPDDGALAAAWAHYKTHNDPPRLHPNDSSERMAAAFACPVAEWRAAAWAWHDRRHALAARLTLQDAWPRCLRWTDSECDQVDRWIAGGEETPEAFWVRLKPIAPPLEGIDLANYEQTGSPFDAESMWTCRTCRGRPHKSQRVEDERPEHVRHAPGCRVARREALNAATRNVDEPTNEPTARRQTT